MSRFAEALLPHTDAIRTLSIEWTTYRGKHLVRYRNREGLTCRKQTPDPQEAEQFFKECLYKLRQEVRRP